MDVTFDTTALVDIDRQHEATIALAETLARRDDTLLISTVTVAEILTGANLHADPKQAQANAHRILGQFQWIDLDGHVAEETGRLLAHLHAQGEPIGFQDVAIAATHLATGASVLVTSNKEHFERLPSLEDQIRSPKRLLEELREP